VYVQTLLDVTKDEFLAVMEILRSMKSMSTVQGRQQLVDIVTEQAELDQPLQVTDPDCVDRLLQCIRTALPLFSVSISYIMCMFFFITLSLLKSQLCDS
jgi:hypothetical protein